MGTFVDGWSLWMGDVCGRWCLWKVEFVDERVCGRWSLWMSVFVEGGVCG
jgi:hypothetical protein